jgi:hypothetical protein
MSSQPLLEPTERITFARHKIGIAENTRGDDSLNNIELALRCVVPTQL